MFWIIPIILILGTLLWFTFFFNHGRHFKWIYRILSIYLAVLIIRLFLIDIYRVSSGSMENTLFTGDIILVNKLKIGPLIPKNLLDNIFFRWAIDIEGLTTSNNYIRLKGYGKIHRNEILLFEREMGIMVKRAIATPQDSIDLINGIIKVNGEEIINGNFKNNYRVSTRGINFENLLKDLNYQFSETWSSKHDTIKNLNLTYSQYKIIKEKNLKILSSKNPLKDTSLRIQPFNYYFVGDNRGFSTDSRFFGSIHKDKIIGNVICVLFNPEKHGENIFRIVNFSFLPAYQLLPGRKKHQF